MGLKDLFGRKGPARIALEPMGRTIEASPEKTILQAALDEGIPLAHSCRVGSCTTCKCRLLEGKVKELTDSAYVLTMEEIDAGYILACQAKPKGDVRVFANTQTEGSEAIRHFEGEIVGQRTLTHDIQEVRVALNRPLRFTAGQYTDVRREDRKEGRARSYSFAAAPANPVGDGDRGESEELLFHIRRVPGGEFTDWLHESDRTGARLSLSSAMGSFTLSKAQKPIIGVAGGSGLAPIKAMLEYAAWQRTPQTQRDAIVLFGARTQADLYGEEFLAAIADQWKGQFRFVPVLSHEPVDSDWTGLRGMVTEHIVSEFRQLEAGNLSEAEAYLSGPPPMIDAAVEVLQAAGMPKQSIRFDRFVDASHLAARDPAPAAQGSPDQTNDLSM